MPIRKVQDGRVRKPRALSSLHGLTGGDPKGMSATSFQRKRRELREQTSVSARMNEEGPYDPYAKADENYDAVGLKDTGAEHQAGDPPPYSLTPHVPEKLEQEPGAVHQAGEPPTASVEEREGEEPPYSDQRRYDALDSREHASAEASLKNVSLADPDSVNATDGAKELAETEGVDLSAVEGSGSGGRITKSDVEKHLEG